VAATFQSANFNIAILFRLWIYLEFDTTFHIWKGTLYFVLFLTYHAEIIMQFSIFEINRWKVLKLRDLLLKLWDVNFSGIQYRNSQGMILSR